MAYGSVKVDSIVTSTQTITVDDLLKKTGGTVTGNLEIGTAGSLTFEGSTADGNETTLAVTDPTADRTITLPDATGTVALLGTAQSYSAAQRGTVSALTSAATVTADFATANNFSLTLAHNVTLANPSNLTAGQSGAVVLTQAASGGPYTVSYGTYWKFPGGTVPTKTTTASSVCVLLYYVESTTRITAQLLNDVKV